MTALRGLVSTFARSVPVRTIDPARGSSFARATTFSSSSSTDNLKRDLRHRSVTMGMSSSGGPVNLPTSFISSAWAQVTGSGSRVFLYVSDGRTGVTREVLWIRTCWAH